MIGGLVRPKLKRKIRPLMRDWSVAEVDMLKMLLPIYTFAKIGKVLNRTAHACSDKSANLGLPRKYNLVPVPGRERIWLRCGKHSRSRVVPVCTIPWPPQ